MADERKSKLLITFVAFLVLLNYPILGIVDKQLLFLDLLRGAPLADDAWWH